MKNHSYKGDNHVTPDMARNWWTYPETRKVKAKLKSMGSLASEFEVAQFSTFGVHDKDGKFYDFYELEFINQNESK